MSNIVLPYAEIVDYPQNREEGIGLLRKVERIGRVSHRSEDKQTEDSWERFIKSVVLGHRRLEHYPTLFCNSRILCG